MATASETLERLEFTFWTRFSYVICLLGGLGLVVKKVIEALEVGEIDILNAGLGGLLALFTLIVWRARVNQVTPLLPEALAESNEGEAEDAALARLRYRSLARRFVILGRKSMAKELAKQVRELAKK